MPRREKSYEERAPQQTFLVVADVHREAEEELHPVHPIQEDDADSPGGVVENDQSSISSQDEEETKQPKNKTSYPWKKSDRENLAAFFEDFPMFYDTCMDEYKDVNSKRAVVKKFVKEIFEDKGRTAPTYAQVIGFLKNYRTRFVKLHSKRSGQADEQLSATEQWVMTNFGYLRPHIKKKRSRVTHQFTSSKTSRNPKSKTPSIASHSDQEDTIQSTPSNMPKEVLDKGSSSSRRTETVQKRSSRDSVVSQEDTDEQLSRILARADEAMEQRRGQNLALSSHEAEIKSFAQYLTTLMTKVPQGPQWVEYTQQVLSLTRDFSGRHGLQHQKPESQQQQSQQFRQAEQQQQRIIHQPNSNATFISVTPVRARLNPSEESLLSFLQSQSTIQASAPTTTSF